MWIATAKSERGLFSLLAHFLPHQRERANGDSSSRTPFRFLDFIFSDVWRSSNTWANILNHCEVKIPSITPERYQCSFAKKNRDHSNTGFRICRISASLVTLRICQAFFLPDGKTDFSTIFYKVEAQSLRMADQRRDFHDLYHPVTEREMWKIDFQTECWFLMHELWHGLGRRAPTLRSVCHGRLRCPKFPCDSTMTFNLLFISVFWRNIEKKTFLRHDFVTERSINALP